MTYAGHCVWARLSGYDEAIASGATISIATEGEFVKTTGISAVYVEQTNIFEGQIHENTDNWVIRYWDAGRPKMPTLLWEPHDEGDMDPVEATGSFSSFGEASWSSAEEVAKLLNISAAELTPEAFNNKYRDVWIKSHEVEAAVINPNPQAELDILNEVENDAQGTSMPANTNEVNLSEDQLQFPATVAPPGQNFEETSVTTNYINIFNNKQLFLIGNVFHLGERPSSPLLVD
ncbi:hypothetical protein ACHAWF_002633 [Thalassiosira exigua]